MPPLETPGVTPLEQSPAPEEQQQIQEQPDAQTETTIEQPQEEAPADGQATLQQEEVDERGIPWKNRAMELERKLNEMPTIIQKTVQESLAQNQQAQQTQTKPQYTVAQLEQYAQENPQYRGWVEEQKALIIQQNLEKTFDERLKADRQQQTNAQVRQQTEQWVTNHPKFKDCFVTDFTGNKVWNMQNPITQVMSQILNQQDPITGKLVKDRPDGLAVAAEMAYGRYMLSSEPKTQSTVKTLQKQLRQTQKQTMTVGQGVNSSGKSMSEYAQHKANYEKTYSKDAASAMTKAYLKSIGIIKEQGE